MNLVIGYWHGDPFLVHRLCGTFGQGDGGGSGIGGSSQSRGGCCVSLGAWAMFVCRSYQAEAVYTIWQALTIHRLNCLV